MPDQGATMRLTIAILGFELDVTLGRGTQDDVEDDWSPGSYTSQPIGFAPNPEVPYEHDAPRRLAWASGDEDT